MHPRALPVLLVGVVLLACGGETPGGDDDAAVEIDAAAPDAAAGCQRWDRVEVTAVEAPVSLDPVAVTAARTTRIQVVGSVNSCDRAAMTVVRYDEATRRAFAPIAVFRPDPVCPTLPTEIRRPIELRLPTAGTWTVYAGPDDSAPSMTIAVGAAPDRACGGVAGCEMDCDCTSTHPGERCLGGYGLGGPFTACATPCEVDRDCGGDGRCESADDGLELVCYDVGPECAVDRPCPAGFDCAGGTCVASFTLNQSTRSPCGCDADCTAPLSCMADADGEGARCEMPCPTDGPWCSGPHFCATRDQDLSGLAGVDGVCGWVGE